MSIKGSNTFCVLPQGSWLGDYQVIFGLISTIHFKSIDAEIGKEKDSSQDTYCMAINKDVFMNILEMFPKSAKIMKKLAAERR